MLYFIRVLQEIHVAAHPQSKMPIMRRIIKRLMPNGTDRAGSNWDQTREIDPGFDQHTYELDQATRSWWGNMAKSGYQTEEIGMAGRWGLLLRTTAAQAPVR